MSLRSCALLLALCLSVAGCGEDAQMAEVVASPVHVAPVGLYTVEVHIDATGELQARAEAAVASQVSGQVTIVHREEGEKVAAGDLVLEIDPERHELELRNQRARSLETEAQLAEQRRDLRRVEGLHQRGVASDAQLDQARTALASTRSRHESAVAQLGLAKRALQDSSVTAPFGGYLGRRHVSEGEFVATGAPLFDLVALDPIEVEFHLPERDSSRVALGDPVSLRVAPYPDETFTATVHMISPTIDPRTRTLRVKARIDNNDGRLRPGLFARVDLGVEVREGVAMVPAEAVLQRADGSVAFRLLDGNRVERRSLRTGVFQDGRVEILEGLAAGDRVVVRGQAELVDGAAVSLRDLDGSPAEGPATAAVEVAP